MEEVKSDIEEMKRDLEQIKNDMKILMKICEKMSSHINFVEDTYDTLKHPLNFMCKKLNYISGKDVKEIDNQS